MLKWEWLGEMKGRHFPFALGKSAAILENWRHGLNEWGRLPELVFMPLLSKKNQSWTVVNMVKAGSI